MRISAMVCCVSIATSSFADVAILRPRNEIVLTHSCPSVLSGDGDGQIALTQTIWDTSWSSFDDPVPFGSVVTRIEATLWGYDWWGGGEGVFAGLELADRQTTVSFAKFQD